MACPDSRESTRRRGSPASWLLGAMLAALAIPAHAGLVTVEMLGIVSGKEAAFLSAGTVRVGDTFRLLVSYDDVPRSTTTTTVNGSEVYTLLDHDVTYDLADWSGSLADEIRANNTGLLGTVSGGSSVTDWRRPLATRHHRDWTITGGFTLQIVTDYHLNPGGEHYGWWYVGSNGAIDRGFMSLTDVRVFTADPPVPASSVGEPPVLALLVLGLVALRRSPFRHTVSGP